MIVLLAAASAVATADVIRKLDAATLRAGSEAVIRASVREVKSDWNGDRSFIFTTVTLDVLEQYTGRAPARIHVRVPGGSVGGYTISAESMPRFHAGDEVIVHLTRWPDGAYMVTGYHQGLSNITPSPQGPILRGGTLDKRRLADAERELRGAAPARP